MKLTRKLGFTLALCVGAIVGAVTSLSGGAMAYGTYTVDNQPGGTATLTCG